MIKLNEKNDDLRTGQLTIFIRRQWSLVDGGPDENPRHLKNIKVYCQLFKKFNLDYLSIRTYATGQSKYNPVERGMATLSDKLAGVTLLINHSEVHLNTQGKVNQPIFSYIGILNFRGQKRVLGYDLHSKFHGRLKNGEKVDLDKENLDPEDREKVEKVQVPMKKSVYKH
ncbi:8074_t:CDS:2 [Funneliformis geosporum]|uniref:8074_t:CDS:1 n=1 Tax=Funneliformis geosporum TaxID=1117311 RepID=A0A9W4T0A2_9GLOM|nr:8074_t:CDS:2 [Funneliformis geosporum]